jgi:hypothetical protein
MALIDNVGKLQLHSLHLLSLGDRMTNRYSYASEADCKLGCKPRSEQEQEHLICRTVGHCQLFAGISGDLPDLTADVQEIKRSLHRRDG